MTAIRECPYKVSSADVLPSRRLGGDDRALLTPASVGATSGFMGTMVFQPGEYVAAHYHPHSEEFLFVVRGSLVVRISGEEVVAVDGDAVYIPRGAVHRIENANDSMALVVYHIGPLAPSPQLGHVDVEPVPNPADRPPVVGE